MENYSPMDVMAMDTGMPEDMEAVGDYVKYKMEKGSMIFGSNDNMMYDTDESGGRLICCLEDGKKEVYFGYNTEIKTKAVISEYLKNIYDKDFGAVVIEDKEGELYNLCAEIDFYNAIERTELPSNALLKVYALALDIKIFKDKSEFDQTVNRNPIVTTEEGKPIKFGTTFMSPSGIMPGNEEELFPSMTYIISEVKNIESKINSVTKKEFYVLTCSGVFGDFELLCSPEFIDENIEVGSVVLGYVVFRTEILKTWKIGTKIN